MNDAPFEDLSTEMVTCWCIVEITKNLPDEN